MNKDKGSLSDSGRFRSALRDEIPKWVDQGLVGASQGEELAVRYRLGDLERESTRLLAAVIFTLGGLLLGGGLIAFVAANWERFPDAVKLLLLLGALAGFHGVGFTLWRRGAWKRLGASLILCGCLVFGANIGLVAQIFHVQSDWWRGCGAWAAGTLAVAWALTSIPVAVLALVISFVWFCGCLFEGGGIWFLYPPILCALFVPLALRAKSRALHGLTAGAFLLALPFLGGENGRSGVAILLAWVAAGFAAWAWGRRLGAVERFRNLGPAATVLGAVSLAAASYFWSFHEIWEEMGEAPRAFLWTAFAGGAVLLGVVFLLDGWTRRLKTGPWDLPAASILASAVLLAACGLLYLSQATTVLLPTVLTNAAALLLAAGAVGSGLSYERRSRFWAGTLFAVILVLSRFLEYDTSLMLKAAAFTACGGAVLWAGIAYERFLGRKEVARV